ncbi:MAG: peptide deformylase [Patescibacteria group bacterium]|jgi:peptide deformylase
MNIITHPNPILRKKSAKIEKIDNKIKRLVLDMEKTMLEKDGVGLAAPQVEENIRLIVINTKDGPIHLINPKITTKSWRKELGEEGCLSIPEIYGQVKRHKTIRVIYYNKNNDQIKIRAEGLLARVIQHEIDHLNGILFTDYLQKKNLPEGFEK